MTIEELRQALSIINEEQDMSQQQTQLSITVKESDSKIKVNEKGQNIAFGITLVALGLCGYSLHLSNEIAAAVLGATPFFTLIGKFLRGSMEQK